ncbi:PhoD-like phosphatase N-terminal domain-containing protein [Nocardia sp. NPDC002869]|uniref:PhoD-like phosphatase N-terminal domain-containing protein n=1 Tax=Nocardia sp. NPDC002869 TaxID=3161032 RepID=UPI00398CD77B
MSGNGSVSNIGVPVASDRRTGLRAGAVTAAAAALPVPTASAASPVFGHGIASGDPLPDGVVLWTRVTVGPQALPGSGIGAPATVR